MQNGDSTRVHRIFLKRIHALFQKRDVSARAARFGNARLADEINTLIHPGDVAFHHAQKLLCLLAAVSPVLPARQFLNALVEPADGRFAGVIFLNARQLALHVTQLLAGALLVHLHMAHDIADG